MYDCYKTSSVMLSGVLEGDVLPPLGSVEAIEEIIVWFTFPSSVGGAKSEWSRQYCINGRGM